MIISLRSIANRRPDHRRVGEIYQENYKGVERWHRQKIQLSLAKMLIWPDFNSFFRITFYYDVKVSALSSFNDPTSLTGVSMISFYLRPFRSFNGTGNQLGHIQVGEAFQAGITWLEFSSLSSSPWLWAPDTRRDRSRPT